jgi:hypothetical protein
LTNIFYYYYYLLLFNAIFETLCIKGLASSQYILPLRYKMETNCSKRLSFLFIHETKGEKPNAVYVITEIIMNIRCIIKHELSIKTMSSLLQLVSLVTRFHSNIFLHGVNMDHWCNTIKQYVIYLSNADIQSIAIYYIIHIFSSFKPVNRTQNNACTYPIICISDPCLHHVRICYYGSV